MALLLLRTRKGETSWDPQDKLCGLIKEQYYKMFLTWSRKIGENKGEEIIKYNFFCFSFVLQHL